MTSFWCLTADFDQGKICWEDMINNCNKKILAAFSRLFQGFHAKPVKPQYILLSERHNFFYNWITAVKIIMIIFYDLSLRIWLAIEILSRNNEEFKFYQKVV